MQNPVKKVNAENIKSSDSKKFTRREACPICKGESKKTLYSSPYTAPEMWTELVRNYGVRVKTADFASIDYTLLECANCQTVYQSFVPSPEILASIYGENQIEENGDLTYSIEKYLDYSQEILKICDFLKTPARDLKVLDYGMGYGRWAHVAKTIGCDTYGVEYLPEYISIAEKNNIKVVKDEDITHHHFHFINTEQVFEHLPEPTEVIERLAQALAPGGLLKISVPTSKNIRGRIKKMDWSAPKFSKDSLNPVAPLEHIQCFNKKSLDLMAKKAGFKRVNLPLSSSYKYMNHWSSLRALAKNIFLPLLNNYSSTRNYVFYRK